MNRVSGKTSLPTPNHQRSPLSLLRLPHHCVHVAAHITLGGSSHGNIHIWLHLLWSSYSTLNPLYLQRARGGRHLVSVWNKMRRHQDSPSWDRLFSNSFQRGFWNDSWLGSPVLHHLYYFLFPPYFLNNFLASPSGMWDLSSLTSDRTCTHLLHWKSGVLITGLPGIVPSSLLLLNAVKKEEVWDYQPWHFLLRKWALFGNGKARAELQVITHPPAFRYNCDQWCSRDHEKIDLLGHRDTSVWASSLWIPHELVHRAQDPRQSYKMQTNACNSSWLLGKATWFLHQYHEHCVQGKARVWKQTGLDWNCGHPTLLLWSLPEKCGRWLEHRSLGVK